MFCWVEVDKKEGCPPGQRSLNLSGGNFVPPNGDPLPLPPSISLRKKNAHRFPAPQSSQVGYFIGSGKCKKKNSSKVFCWEDVSRKEEVSPPHLFSFGRPSLPAQKNTPKHTLVEFPRVPFFPHRTSQKNSKGTRKKNSYQAKVGIWVPSPPKVGLFEFGSQKKKECSSSHPTSAPPVLGSMTIKCWMLFRWGAPGKSLFSDAIAKKIKAFSEAKVGRKKGTSKKAICNKKCVPLALPSPPRQNI